MIMRDDSLIKEVNVEQLLSKACLTEDKQMLKIIFKGLLRWGSMNTFFVGGREVTKYEARQKQSVILGASVSPEVILPPRI